MSSPYLNGALSSLPRVLALFDQNPISPTMGVGDRYHFAWKGKDFTNGTFQGAVHGLACLVANNLLPKEISRKSMLSKINCIIHISSSI